MEAPNGTVAQREEHVLGTDEVGISIFPSTSICGRRLTVRTMVSKTINEGSNPSGRAICRMWCNGNIRDCGSRVEGSIPSDLPIWLPSQKAKTCGCNPQGIGSTPGGASI